MRPSVIPKLLLMGIAAGWCVAILVMAYPANVLGQDPADEFAEAGAVFAGYEGSWTVTVGRVSNRPAGCGADFHPLLRRKTHTTQ